MARITLMRAIDNEVTTTVSSEIENPRAKPLRMLAASAAKVSSRSAPSAEKMPVATPATTRPSPIPASAPAAAAASA